MAKKHLSKNIKNTVSYARPIARTEDGLPLDFTGFYSTLSEAQTYANTNNSYVGQIINVIEGNRLQAYQISTEAIYERDEETSELILKEPSVLYPLKYNKQCCVGSDNTRSSGWYKVADGIVNQHEDINLRFYVCNSYNSGAAGILLLHIRSDGQARVNQFGWLNRHSSLSVNCCRLVLSGYTWNLYCEVPQQQWGRMHFQLLNELRRQNILSTQLKLYDSTEKESTDPSDTYVSTDLNLSQGPTSVNGDLTVSGKLSANKLEQNIFDLVYPVGSIYISVNNTNPEMLFGGTWTRFGEGRTLIGSSEDAYAEQEGGSETRSIPLPAHMHSITSAVHTHELNLDSITIEDHTHSTPALSAGSQGCMTFRGHEDRISVKLCSSWGEPEEENKTNGSYAEYQKSGPLTRFRSHVNNWASSAEFSETDGAEYVVRVDTEHTHASSITGSAGGKTLVPSGSIEEASVSITCASNGTENASISVMQPYITVYMWKRTA